MNETTITLDMEKIQKIKLFIATPMYGGQCYGMYTKSLLDTANLFTNNGIEHQIYFLFNESLVTR